jgi:hypothetical protein
MSWQQVSVGVHNAGSRCDVELDGDLLRFWIGDELVETAARISTGGTKQTGPPHQCTGPNPTPECQGSTDSEQGHTDIPAATSGAWLGTDVRGLPSDAVARRCSIHGPAEMLSRIV